MVEAVLKKALELTVVSVWDGTEGTNAMVAQQSDY